MPKIMKALARLGLLAIAAGPALADTVLHDLRGYTPTADGLRQFSVLVIGDDGRVRASGDAGLAARYPDARRIDGRGRVLLPGLTDAHAHVASLGFLAVQLDLAGVRSLDEAVARIGAFAADRPHADWILGRGWNQVLWQRPEFPTAADIDRVVAERPVWLRRVDGHAGWANSRALELAGIGDDTPDPPGGKILRGPDGKASGVLVDNAMQLVSELVPPPDKGEIREAIAEAGRQLLALGITGVHDAGIDLREAEVYMSMASDRQLALRIYAMLSGAGANLDGIGEPLLGHGDDRLDIRSVKLYADGALGSRGAALLEPYSDDAENRGLPIVSAAELREMTGRANRLGFQVGIHAIGDRGNRMALDTFEQVQDGRGSPLRNRIEHAQIIALEDIPRFARLGVIASIQPTHATSDMNMAEDRVGSERIKGGYAWRRLLEHGTRLAAGSDFPVELANPFHGLYAAVTRRDRQGQPAGGWYADQALTRYEALRAFTLDAAYAAHQEQRLGSLEAGKWADFIIIDRNYFECAADEIDDIQVLETWVGGERVYPSNEAGK